MVLGNDEVELLLWVLGIRGEFRGDALKDCELLGWFNGNADQGAIRAEELDYLLAHESILFPG